MTWQQGSVRRLGLWCEAMVLLEAQGSAECRVFCEARNVVSPGFCGEARVL